MTRPVGAAPAWDVRSACMRVAAVAQQVRTVPAALDALAAELAAAPPPPPPWNRPHPSAEELGAEAAAGWVLLLSALNFCFWERGARWRVGGHDGYMALAHALRRAHEAGAPVTDPRAWSGWSVAELRAVLRGDPGGSPVPPLIAERSAVAGELGRWLVEEHGGSVLHALDALTAAELAGVLGANLRGFRDVAEYRGFRVPLLKRAQIAAADCGSALGSAAPGLLDRRGLTAFADYKVPQVLRACGALAYAPALAAMVDAGDELDAGSEAEVEIRALTVVAVEDLTERLRARGVECDAVTVDGWLWWRGQAGAPMPPYHRTRTIWY